MYPLGIYEHCRYITPCFKRIFSYIEHMFIKSTVKENSIFLGQGFGFDALYTKNIAIMCGTDSSRTYFLFYAFMGNLKLIFHEIEL